VSLIAVTMILLSTGLCMAQGQADTTDYVVKLNELGIAGRAESDNAATYYQKAIELFVTDSSDLTKTKFSWPKELPAQEQAVLRKWVQDNSAALEQLRLGSQKPYCWFTHTGQISPAESNRSMIIRDLARALSFRAMLQAEDGGVSGAVNDIETLYRFGAHSEAGPRLLVEKLMGIAIKSMAVTNAFKILNETLVNADLMKGLQEQLEQLCPKQNESFDIRGEKIHMQGQIETDPKAAPLKPYLQNVFEYYDTIATKTPWQLHTQRVPAIPNVDSLITDMTKIIEIEYRSRADTQALITTLALMRYKSDKGGYPAALPELVSAGYIKEQPIDPFSNNPLVYKQAQDNFTLYSFGVDFDDDGGQPSKWGSGEEGGDQVFWPLKTSTSEEKQVAERKLPTGPEQEKLTASLNRAVIAGDTSKVQSLISVGADINGKGRQGWTPLHTAIWYGKNEVVEPLISKGADINAKDDRGNSLLHFAAIKGNSDAASLLIAKGADIDAKTSAQQTPLLFAVEYSRKDIVEMLIAKGANVNAQAGNDNALSLAKRKNNNEIEDLLLKHGAEEPTSVLMDEGLYGRENLTEQPAQIQSSGLESYMDFEGQTQRRSTRSVRSVDRLDILADPNEIKARIKTFEGLEKAIEKIDSKSRSEKSAWLQSRIDNRTSLLRILERQVEQELTFVRNIAVEEKAEKTTKIIDYVLSSRDDVSGKVRKELLVQRREARQSQTGSNAGAGPRGRGRDRDRTSRGKTGRGARGRNPQEGYPPGQFPEQTMAGPYGLRSESNEGQDLAPETENKIRQWLQTTIDNKNNLLQFVHTDIQTQYASIRTVAVEEEAKKTIAAFDGILLRREERFENIVQKMEEQAQRESQQMQDPRDRNLRTTRGRYEQDARMRGQEQFGDESASRTRRRR
jgi:hypothetical protein